MHLDDSSQQSQSNVPQILIGVAVLAGVVSLLIAVLGTPARFFQAYLIGWLFWVEIAVGCLGLVMLNNLVNGRWLYPILRIAEAGTRTLPLLAILFIPIILGLADIYPWAGEAAEGMKGGKAVMLQPTFFVLRSFIYVAVWSWLGWRLTGWSYQRDRDENAASEDTMRNFSAVGMIFYVLTTTLAAFDWTMSLDPEFFSSAFGWAVLSRMFLAMIALVIIVLAIYWNREPLASAVTKQVTNDLGAILLMSVLVWIYFYGIQIIIIYSGNVAFNTLWFGDRITEGWRGVTSLFAVLNAGLLILLLIPGIKGQRNNLVALALFTLILRAFEMHWVVMPTYTSEFSVELWDFAPIVALGGFWLAAMLFLYSREKMLPVHHPSFGGNNALAGASEAYTASDGI